LKKQFPDDEALHTWAKAVKALYDEAIAWAELGLDPNLSPRK
jgi:transposase